jgi:ABC-type nickel/cobalt efflux system permease component RcnA
MFGLDDWLVQCSDGATLVVVIGVAILLGLRHATDPDHLAAVTTLVASGKERTRRLAARLGFAWGLGHALTLFAFGLPIVLFKAYLPEPVQQGTETTIGLVIIALAVWLLARWKRGVFHVHLHAHRDRPHVHTHWHDRSNAHPHAYAIRARSPLQAFGIGLIHGMGGSAGVGILLLATIRDHAVAVAALALLAFFTAVSMALLSTGFGLTLSGMPVRRSFHRIAPVLGATSLLFGVWYSLGALAIAPYYF